jgi:two-component system, LytTR family, sensor kinase
LSRVASSIAGGIRAGDGVVKLVDAAEMVPDPVAQSFDVEYLIGARRGRWWGLAGIWLAVAVSVGFGLFVNFQAQGRAVSFGAALMAMIPHYFFWVLVSPPLYRALHKTIAGRRRVLWLTTLVGWSVAALAGSTAMSYTSYVVRRDLEPTFRQFVEVYVLPPVGPAFWAMNLSILALALASFAVVRSQRLRDRALWNAAQTELHGAQLKAELAEARLQALQAQINPHFLLNSLNSIAGLVQTGDRDRAFDAIGGLGELLRLALRSSRDLSVTLGEEIDFLERYLQLCKLRFEDRFNYSVSMPDALRARRVPALVVQPLVENAIRHGMEPPRPLNVEIRGYAQGSGIVIEVEDDGRGAQTQSANGESLPRGHGLANVYERLRLSFGEAGDLRLEPREPRGTRALIIIGR